MVTFLMVMSFVIGGCSSHKPRFEESDMHRLDGEITIGQSNYGSMNVAQQQLEQALNGGENSPVIYEQLLLKYGSENGDFERAVYTALSLEYLKQGKLDDFKFSSQRLMQHMNDGVMISHAMQYVLEISRAMYQTAYVGRNYDPKLQNVIHDILQ